jgi:hypothetical protein
MLIVGRGKPCRREVPLSGDAPYCYGFEHVYVVLITLDRARMRFLMIISNGEQR